MLRPLLTATLVCAALIASAEEDPLFDFIPDGGRTLLEAARAEGLTAPLEDAITGGAGTIEEWQARIAEAGGLALDQWQTDTLAQYLAIRAPLAEGDLPPDGRDLILARCQSCHIITVVITQDRPREAWLRTMNGPSHIEIETSEAERDLIADYLVTNAGIPIDDVPVSLRAGGATY